MKNKFQKLEPRKDRWVEIPKMQKTSSFFHLFFIFFIFFDYHFFFIFLSCAQTPWILLSVRHFFLFLWSKMLQNTGRVSMIYLFFCLVNSASIGLGPLKPFVFLFG